MGVYTGKSHGSHVVTSRARSAGNEAMPVVVFNYP